METNIIHLTDVGLQAINNASAAGMLVDANTFKVGTSSAAYQDSDVDIQGQVVHLGIIHYVEVLSETSVRFTMDVPAHVGGTDGQTIAELGIFLPNGTMLGRAVFEPTTKKVVGVSKRIVAVLHTTRCDLTVVNVTIGDYSSIPASAYIKRLPNPVQSDFNVISVLDGQTNPDGSTSAILAHRYGAGDMHWAFANHTRLYLGNPEAGGLTLSKFQATGMDTLLVDSETVIVQIVSGAGAGETRRFVFASSDDFLNEADTEPFTNLTSSSTIAVWQSLSKGDQLGMTVCTYPPDTQDIPADWVLTRGTEPCPVWQPPSLGGRTLNTLYLEPSELNVVVISDVGTGRKRTYSLNGVVVQNVNDILVSLGSITQHKTAFTINGSQIEFAEDIPVNVPIEIRVFDSVVSSGSRTIVGQDTFISDGSAEYQLTNEVQSAEYLLVSVSGAHQHMFSYLYDAPTNKVVFIEAVKAGLEIQVRTLTKEPAPGYSTDNLSYLFHITDDTSELVLPIEPESKEHVLVSASGFRVHTNKYAISENTIQFDEALPRDLEIEVVVVVNRLAEGTPQTDLAGVVVDAVQSSKYLSLLRHNRPPVNIPVQSIVLKGGKGVRVTGSFPRYEIASTLAEKLETAGQKKFSTVHTLQDTEEIIYSYRIDIDSDMIILVTADFAANLGPGFTSTEGTESMEYVLGFRTTGAREPDYARRIKGTGTAGFNSLSGGRNESAYSNASITQIYEVVKNNIPAGYLDIIAKMRVQNATISRYGSLLNVNFNVIAFPKI